MTGMAPGAWHWWRSVNTLAVLGLCSALAAAPGLAAPLTLNDALAQTYQSNPQLEGARAAVEALDQGVAQANAGWRPSINLSGSYGTQHATVQGVGPAFNSNPLQGAATITQPILRLRTFADIGRAIADVDAGRAQLTLTEQNILFAAVTAYMDVVRDIAALQVSQSNVRVLEKENNSVHVQFSAGAVTRTDVSQTEARLARARADQAVAGRQLETSRAAFETVIGRPAGTLEETPAEPALPKTRDAALAVALDLHPALAQAKASAKSADYSVKEQAAAMLPEFSISGQYQYQQDVAGSNLFASRIPQQSLGIIGQITVPIYQGGGEQASVRRAVDLRREAELAIVTAERGVRQDVSNAWQAKDVAQSVLLANEAQAAADQDAVNGVVQEQQGGERSVLDVLNAQEELFSAQLAVIASRHDSVVSAYQLLLATGQLTARALRLDVAIKDPRDHYDRNADAWFGLDQ